MLLDSFARAPFHLDSDALAWVERTLAGLDVDGKLGQIMVAAACDMQPSTFDAALAARVGGIHRRVQAPVEALRTTAADLQSRSLGNPFHLYEMPDCPTYVNAYSPVLPVQEAVVKALTGELPFRGVSPVDPFTGL